MKKNLFLTLLISFFCFNATSLDQVQDGQAKAASGVDIDSLKQKMASMLGVNDGVSQSRANIDNQITGSDKQEKSFLPRTQKFVFPKNSVLATQMPKNSPLRVALSDAYDAYKSENIEVALAYYKKAVSIDPKNLDALFGLGSCYQLLGQSDEALKSYVQALEIDPDYYPAKNNMIILISGNSVEKAISELLKINDKHPNNAFVLAQIGTMYSYVEKYTEAIFYLGKAIENEPSNPFYSYNMAVTFDQMKKYKDAYNYYDHTLSLITSSTLLDKNIIYDRMTFLKSCVGIK